MAVINNKSGDYTIDGVAVVDPQTPHKFQLNSTGIFYRNMNATRNGYLVANLKKLFWSWNRLTASELDEILSILYKKLDAGSDEFVVRSYIRGKGFVQDNYYLGQPLEYTLENGVYKMELKFIQVAGRLNIQ